MWNIWERTDCTWSLIEKGLSYDDASHAVEVRALCERTFGQGTLVALPTGEYPVEPVHREL